MAGRGIDRSFGPVERRPNSTSVAIREGRRRARRPAVRIVGGGRFRVGSASGFGGPVGTLPSAMDTAPLIEPTVLERVLARSLASGGDMAEVFAEDRQNSSAMLDDRKVEELSSGRERGAGIRVVIGETTGYAHTADLSEAGLLAAAEGAPAVARQGGGTRIVALGPRRAASPRAEILPGDVAKAAKLELLARADEAARAAGGA